MRKIHSVMKAPAGHWVGDGFPVRSLFSPRDSANLSPFLLLDYGAPYAFAPSIKPRGVGAHPHRGFETVTIVFQGEVAHRDSTGQGGVIGAGDVQWMTAAGGIVHEEFHSPAFAGQGGVFEVAQLWVNLPAKDKMSDPGYQAIQAADIPCVELDGGAGEVRIIAGEFAGRTGPARTFTPIEVWDLRLTGRTELTLPEGHTLAAAVLSGEVTANGATTATTGEIVIFDRTGGKVAFETADQAKLLILAGEPIDEPVASYGPFVMNTEDELRRAIVDFESGRFGRVAA